MNVHFQIKYHERSSLLNFVPILAAVLFLAHKNILAIIKLYRGRIFVAFVRYQTNLARFEFSVKNCSFLSGDFSTFLCVVKKSLTVHITHK
jgi:hypothetical protein